jgi:hypothetical protein
LTTSKSSLFRHAISKLFLHVCRQIGNFDVVHAPGVEDEDVGLGLGGDCRICVRLCLGFEQGKRLLLGGSGTKRPYQP